MKQAVEHIEPEAEIEAKSGENSVSLGGNSHFLSLVLSLLVLTGVVAMFLRHLEVNAAKIESVFTRIEEAQAAESANRIQRCHNVSEMSTLAMEKVSTALDANTRVLSRVEHWLELNDDRNRFQPIK